MQAVAEARLFEPQVALDMIELLAERHVRATVAEQVTGELGEIDQQLASLFGTRVDVPGHRRQRVVDEMGEIWARSARSSARASRSSCSAMTESSTCADDEARRLLDDPQLGLAGSPTRL